MISFIMAGLGAIVYRLRGWGPKDQSIKYWWKKRPLLQTLFALPFALVFAPLNAWCILPVLIITTLGVITGHASIIDLGTVKDGSVAVPADGQQDEWYTHWIPGKGYWHDFAGLIVSGALITASCGLAFMYLGYWTIGLLILASGALKAPAYAISWATPNDFKYRGLPLGEFLTGAFLWGSLSFAISCL